MYSYSYSLSQPRGRIAHWEDDAIGSVANSLINHSLVFRGGQYTGFITGIGCSAAVDIVLLHYYYIRIFFLHF